MTYTAHPGESSLDPSARVLDSVLLLELMASLNEPVTVAALYRKFIGNAGGFINDLRTQDEAARSDTLHTLKGSAAMMGAQRMAAVISQLQAQLQRSALQTGAAIATLESELRTFRDEASAQLNKLGAKLEP